MNDDPVEIDGKQIDATPMAFKIETAEGELWLSRSQVTWIEGGKSFTIPEWLAMDKGLI